MILDGDEEEEEEDPPPASLKRNDFALDGASDLAPLDGAVPCDDGVPHVIVSHACPSSMEEAGQNTQNHTACTWHATRGEARILTRLARGEGPKRAYAYEHVGGRQRPQPSPDRNADITLTSVNVLGTLVWKGVGP